MTQAHFDRVGVQRLLDHAKAAPAHTGAYGQKPPFAPGLFLVGDEGIYLMSNGDPHLPHEDGKPNHSFVVYAREADPTKMDFETWWEAKRRIFGGDDGSELLDAAEIEAGLATYRPDEPLILDITTKVIWLVSYRVRAGTSRLPRQRSARR